MINYVQEGKTINYSNAGSAITAGSVVRIGDEIGVAMVDIAASTGTGAVALQGVFSLTKVGSQSWAQGDKIFWDHTNNRCTKTASGDADQVIGFAWKAVGSGAGETTGLVKLGSLIPAKAGPVSSLGGTLTGTTDGILADVAAIALSTSDTYTDAAVNGAVNTAITSVNLQLKEIQSTVNALISNLRQAGIIDN